MYLKSVPVSRGMDLDKLGKASEGFTGADIANVCREAKTKALSASIKSGQEIKITQEDLEAILQKVRPSAPNIVVSSYLTFLARYGQR
jgi:SpoVK/Ycf46/Vps4 family AAA+-type ATPase